MECRTDIQHDNRRIQEERVYTFLEALMTSWIKFGVTFYNFIPFHQLNKLMHAYDVRLPVKLLWYLVAKKNVRPEKFPFLEKGKNRNFDYKIVNFG